jgi:hypothetical protein
MILLALAAAGPPPLCTDRPGKANAVCTVPSGTVQAESTPLFWSLTRAGGVRTDLATVGGVVVKMGLDDSSDLQIGLSPLVVAKVREGGATQKVSGFGDVQVRYKRRLSGADAKVQVVVFPFVKLPTARRGLGNGKIEGGVALPISLAAGKGATLTFGPQLDLIADADGHGRHAALANLVNLTAPVCPRLTVIGEVWTKFNVDPVGTERQASLDGALAYTLSTDVQLDAGANFGLTDATADVELYAGVALRL